MSDQVAHPSTSAVEAIFADALDLPGTERPGYLANACGDNQQLFARVEALLGAHEASRGFMPAQPRAQDPRAGLLGPTTEKPGDRIGRYKLCEKIGEGGCGVVYVAEQEEPVRRRVALKVIKVGMDTRQVIARFEAERQALALMDHLNIAKVLDVGATETGRPYFVMELVRGRKLTDYCDEAQLSIRERLDLFIQVCHAVQHAHQKGIIHRDLKPSNILVTLNDPGSPGVPKVIDFGIAKATNGQQLTDKTIYTAFEQFLGTPAYMSPEQAVLTSQDIDTRSDIYSLGVLLYELLTRQTPFDTKALLAGGLDELRRTICEKDPVRPSKVVERLSQLRAERRGGMAANFQLKSLSTDLDWIVMKALEKDRTRRYETANGLAADLRRFLANEPVVARPPSAGYRIQKFVRRNKALVTFGAAILTVLVVGGLEITWEAIRATQARQEQSRLRELAQAAERTATARLISGEVVNAVRLTEEGNLLGALPWIADSIRLSQGNRVAEDAGRFRFEAAWGQSPHLSVLALHDGRIYSGAFSPDGKRFVTASADHTARVWDVRTGQPVLAPLVHSAEVRQAVYSPDGRRIATVCRDASLWIWDATTGQAICPPIQHELDIKDVAFSPDGRQIATSSGVIGYHPGDQVAPRASSDGHIVTIEGETAVAGTTLGQAQLWDSGTGRAVGPPLRHRDVVRSAAFSPDGRWLVTACQDGSAIIWDVQTGQPAIAPLRHEGRVRCARFSPDGRYVLTASEDHTARLWEARTGAPVGPPLRHAKTVVYAAFSGDGQRIVTTSEDQSARLWDVGTAQPLDPPLRHESDVRYAEFSPDGRWLVTSGSESLVRVWEIGEGTLRAVLQHNGSSAFATFSPDGRYLLTVSRDHFARVWDLLPLSAGLQLRHGDKVWRAEFSHAGDLVLTSSFTRKASLWNALSGTLLNEFDTTNKVPGGTLRAVFAPVGKRFATDGQFGARLVDASTDPPRCIQLTNSQPKWAFCIALFSPDGRLLVTGDRGGTAQVWDAATGMPIGPAIRHGLPISACAFSPDGRHLATGSSDTQPDTDHGEISVWEVQTGRLLGVPIVIRGTVSDLRFDPTGRYVLSAASNPALEEREAQIWDWQTGKPLLPPLRHKDGVPRAEFSPDGRQVLTASFDGTARIWDAQSSQPLTPPLRHARQVEDACFSPDGRQVATASSDHTARVWDAYTGEPITPPLKHNGPVRCVRFSADGRRLITGSEDQTARIWELAKTERPVTDILLLAALASGQQIDGTGKPAPLEPAQLETIWRTLRAKYPADFPAP